MEFDLAPWLNMVLRWLHIIAGISWIGTSFYFIWLDNQLRRRPDMKEGLAGEVWSVHGGGFYHKQKYTVAPDEMPDTLHWFKWESYFTWITGFLLLCVMYYYGAELFLIDSDKADLSTVQAIQIGLACLAGGWVVYDLLCRSPMGREGGLFAITLFILMTVATWGLTQIFSDRGAFIHIGAIIGTIMTGNVFLVIIPNQKKVVASMLAGEKPDPALGLQAKQRSLHNNYLTLPVLLIMISNHYPMLFGNPYNWLVLAGLAGASVLIRHFLNRRNLGDLRPQLAFAAGGLFVIVVLFAMDAQQRENKALAEAAPVPFHEVRQIVAMHCLACHADVPTHPDYTVAPGGVSLSRPEQIRQYAAQIFDQAVASDIMPLGNDTTMSEEERNRLGAWIQQGADIAAGTEATRRR